MHGKQVNQSSDELRVTPFCALPRDRASAPRGQTHTSTQQRSHPPRSVRHSLGVAPKQAAGVSQCQGRILGSRNFEDATSSTSVEGLFQCRGSSEFQPRTESFVRKISHTQERMHMCSLRALKSPTILCAALLSCSKNKKMSTVSGVGVITAICFQM